MENRTCTICKKYFAKLTKKSIDTMILEHLVISSYLRLFAIPISIANIKNDGNCCFLWRLLAHKQKVVNHGEGVSD